VGNPTLDLARFSSHLLFRSMVMIVQVYIKNKTRRNLSSWHLVRKKPLVEFREKVIITLIEDYRYWGAKTCLYEVNVCHKWFETQYWREA
jgi:hypothetical protein